MAAPAAMAVAIEEGRLGRKARKGFYRYDVKGKEVDPTVYDTVPGGKTRVPFDTDEFSERPVLLFLNEAVRCLEEGILRSARDGDVGAVFGLGFPPFRGGPFRTIDASTAAQVVQRLRYWQAKHGDRFTPAALLLRMAEKGERFYPAD
jgi:3-hydroxyacyl-CoA dehydrogenase / enoyl-CoA hydratase / 3-hydroxybutyryl-CoA epimerase